MDKSVKKCESLNQVREAIDEIDEKLIDLLALRSKYVEQAAGFKKNSEEVKAPSRVEEVIRKIRNLAEKKDLSADLAEAMWREMIKHFIAQEMKKL